MKAIVCPKYGSPDVLQLKEVDIPRLKDNEMLIKVKAVSLNQYDLHYITGTPYFIRFEGSSLTKPKHQILGADIAGQVEAVGRSITQFKPGDEVYGENGFGGFAEYACITENRFVLKPVNLTFEESAAVPMAALTALQGLRDKGKIQKGQKVLVNGASGGVGSFAVQIAKLFGAEVTAVCSTAKMDFVRSLGADYIIDYKSEDVTKNKQKYDLIFDTAAYRSISDYKRILSPDAIYVLAGGSMARIIQLMLISKTGNKNMGIMIAKINQQDLLLLKEYIEAGRIKPFIDKLYSLDDTAAALWYLKKGFVRGKAVITV